MSNNQNLLTIGSLGSTEFALRGKPAIRWGDMPRRVGKKSERRYQKVLLLNPSATLYRHDLPRCTYPLGIGYIAAVLEKYDYEVKILDVFAEGYHNSQPIEGDSQFLRYGLADDDVVKVMRAFAPDVVGVSSIFSNQADNVHNLLRLADLVVPEAPTAIGGAHARYFPKACLEDPNLDAVFLGEGEMTFLLWLEFLNGTVREDEVHGVALRDHDGKIRIKPELPLISSMRPEGPETGKSSPMLSMAGELDHIPFPAWHHFNMEKYFEIKAYQSPYTVGSRVGQLYTSRGCTAHCTFCTTTHFWGQKLRRRSVDNVVNEVLRLRDEYGIDEFHIQDDNITNDMDHARELFRAFRDAGLPWATPQGTALWRMDEELLDLMAESGAYQVTFAIESGVQRVLKDLIKKPLNLKRTSHLIKYARGLGMHVHGFFIVGMPPMFGNNGETIDEMQASYEYAEEAGFSSASFFAASPIVGSELLTECIRQGFVDPQESLYRMTYKQGIINVPGLWGGEEIAELAAKFNRDFNAKRERAYTPQKQWNEEQY
ncbi:radical SAM protein [Streptomyces sp. NPDC005181]|uniref:B12-binding domain-containing radical SAM protein n=1 Tax=Streptomyces sp. NPDC005181 TaxID=3156869 RepID=UPI0033BE1B2A